jgi:flagellar protein FliS
MMATQTTDGYRRTQAQAATPLEVVALLYDRILHFMDAATEAIARRDIAARRDTLHHALTLISQLQSTLDMERGGDIAHELDRLYTYVTGRLFDAAIKNDAAPIGEARAVMETLREAWRTIASSPVARS